MISEQRWKWAGIVSVISIGGVLLTDIVANVVSGYISDQIKQSWLEPQQQGSVPNPEPAIAEASKPQTPQAQMASVVAKPATRQAAAVSQSDPEPQTVAAREVLPEEQSAPEGAPLPDEAAVALPEPEPRTLSGTVEKVIDTGKLKIAGETVVLAGVEGLGAPYRDQLAKFIQEQGSQVRCNPSGIDRHVCYVGTIDLGLAALTNGAARPTSVASPQYEAASADARRNHRGVFR